MNALIKRISSIDRRQSKRMDVIKPIRIRSLGNVIDIPSEREAEKDSHWGRIYNTSDCGMCIASNALFSSNTILYVDTSEISKDIDRQQYTGIIIWYTEVMDQEKYCYGMEFLFSWIRRKFYRKQTWKI